MMMRGPYARPLRLRALCAVLAFLAAATTHAGVGETIYRQGILLSGEPLQAEREPGMHIEGATAACINCHRRSGLGMTEGRRAIPPIAGRYLFHPRAANADELDLPFVEGMKADRDPYDEATLARAIRTGVGADGQPLSYLMPHFQLDDVQMASLISYLRSLSPGPVPGVTPSVLHFATIITPDADPVKRDAMLEVLTKFFDDKNRYTRAESPRLHSSRRMMFKVNRHWELHVWQLAGAPQTWEAQLRDKLATQPVFAAISGLGGRTWEPVQHFCEAEGLPCLFPNVDLPVDRQSDFDSLYLSKGVLLEAELIAHNLRAGKAGAPIHRVVQIYRAKDIGKDAAAALRTALHDEAIPVVDETPGAGPSGHELNALLAKSQPNDILVLWLRKADIAALGHPPPRVARVYLSGRMAGLEQAPLPAQWRGLTRMAYPFNLPDRRRVQVDYPLGWFRMRQIPVVAEQVQADTYLVCAIVSDAINHMVDTFVRDYLVERIEELLEHRIITGYYPRLALAPQQRFASKGGYIVRFRDSNGTSLTPEGDWTVP
jgi:hypothetical protein